MAETNSRLEELKFIAGVISAGAGGVAGVLVIVAYMVQRLQFGLLGLPPDSETAAISYSTIGHTIILAILPWFIFISIPIIFLSRILSGIFDKMISLRICKRLFETHWVTSWLLIVVFLFAAIAAVLPSFGLSGLVGPLWLKDVTLDSTAQEALELLIANNLLEKFVAGGLVFSAVGLGFVIMIRFISEGWYSSQFKINNLFKFSISAIALVIAFSSFLLQLAAALFPNGPFPEVTVQLRSGANAGETGVSGFLVRNTSDYYFIVRPGAGEPPASLIPKISVIRIDYRGTAQELKPLLCQRLKGCAMNHKLTIAHMPFSLWAWNCALLLLLGFTLALPRQPAQASPVFGMPAPPFAAAAMALAENNEKATAAVATGDGFLASVQSYFPTVIQSAANLAEAIQLYIGLFNRGDDDEGPTDLWLYQPGAEPRRLTSDGGYSSPRPSRDGKRIAFLRHGRPGILNLTAQTSEALPGSASYERLYGWDETAGTLLAETAEGAVVVLHTDDGRAEPWGSGPVGRLQRANLEVLTRMTGNLGLLTVPHSNGEWQLQEKRWGEEKPVTRVSSHLPISDPAWCAGGGIVYVQPGN